MDLELGGRVAVVTGASKGTGLAVVRTLAEEGAAVIAGARTADTLAGLEGVTALEVDLDQPGGPEALVGHAVERHGRVDLLVNNVGRVQLRVDGSSRGATRTSRRRCSLISSPRCGRPARPLRRFSHGKRERSS